MFTIPVGTALIIILLVVLVMLTIVLMSSVDEMGREIITLLRKIIITIDETKKDDKEGIKWKEDLL
jgi:hypothetical protein